jgi:hypothetical protein
MPDENEIPGQSVIETVPPIDHASTLDAPDTGKDVTPDPTAESAGTEATSDSVDIAEGAQPATSSPSPSPDEHRFRVMVQTHNPGNPVPHSITVTEDMLAEDAIKFLARHVDDLPNLINELELLL